MRVCMILEGCYPFVRGGVSSWVHQYIENSPSIDFTLWTVHATREDTQHALYCLPSNVKEHHMIILDEDSKAWRVSHKEDQWIKDAANAFYRILFSDDNNSFEDLVKALRCGNRHSWSLLKSNALLSIAERASDTVHGLGLADAFYSIQSMLAPICNVISSPIPQADIYHSAVAGYGGLLGAVAAIEENKPFILTEHGIYPREREEELISSEWAIPAMKPLWIKLFYEMSRFAYRHSSIVTSLFDSAKERQIIIGCDPRKCIVIPNGIQTERFSQLDLPTPNNTMHIGAFVRFAAIKDLKTMIRSFAAAKQNALPIILHIMGGTDDENYKASCEALIRSFGLGDSIYIEGHINTLEYMKKMDITILTSISEGQPLTILESMAAGRPCIATRVGNCAGLIEGTIDNIGPAGICCSPMDAEEVANAIVMLYRNPELRSIMGINGRKRIATHYSLEGMLCSYHALYKEVI